MDLISKAELEELINIKADPCISIYIPTYKKGAEVEQNLKRYKIKLREAQNLLKERGYRDTKIDDMLKRAQFLLIDTEYWNSSDEGFAAFIAPDYFLYYKLHGHFDEKLSISDRFYIKPLIPLLSSKDYFYLLALDKKNSKFYKADKFSLNEIQIHGMPSEMEETLGYEWQPEQYHFHSKASANNPSQGKSRVFHGQSFGHDDMQRKKDLLRFFQYMNKSITNYLRDETAPLIIAGVDNLLPIYREANSYVNISEKALAHNTEYMHESDLHKLAWEIYNPVSEKTLTDALKQYGNSIKNGRTSNDLAEIVKASFTNRIQYLFVNQNEEKWGQVNFENFDVDVHKVPQPGDEELLDLVSIQTIIHNGSVFILEPQKMPVNYPLAAVFRYPAE